MSGNRRVYKIKTHREEEMKANKKALICPYCQAKFKDKKTKKAMKHLRDCVMKNPGQKKLTAFFVPK